MGRILIAAAKEPPPNDSEKSTIPKIFFRLTRLQLDASSLARLQTLGLKVVGSVDCLPEDSRESDPRIPETIEELLKMGIDVALGEHEFAVPPPMPLVELSCQRGLVPSCDINLDLSVLIALVSDITHAPLPLSTEEARTRYIPTPAERERSRRRRERQKQLQIPSTAQRNGAPKGKKRRNTDSRTASSNVIKAPSVDGGENWEAEDSDTGESIHSRALADQVLREMNKGLLDEIAETLGDESTSSARFWVSREVRTRCLRIVAKIGGPGERRRAGAILACIGAGSDIQADVDKEVSGVIKTRFATHEEACAAYWDGSRLNRDLVPRLAPLHVYEDASFEKVDVSVSDERAVWKADSPFWNALSATCQRLLSSEVAAHPRISPAPPAATKSTSEPQSHFTIPSDANTNSEGEDEIVRAAVTRANPRLTVHTVLTLARGASATRRWTTLTANRTAVREVLRESQRMQKASGKGSHAGLGTSTSLVGEWSMRDEAAAPNYLETDKKGIAAIWIVGPRSLAESMRGDCVSPR